MASKMQKILNARIQEHNAGQARDIARKGSTPKRSNDGVPVHPDMTSAQKSAAGLGGMSHAVTADTPGAAPLPHAYGNAGDLKTGKGVPTTPGMRSRVNADTETHADKVQAGRDTLAQAVKN